MMVRSVLPDFVASAWLVAFTCTVAGTGRSIGAVYPPLAAMVPPTLFPPATSFTLQVTPVSLVFATLAVNVSELPRSTSLLVDVTLTVMDGGGAGRGVTRPAPPPPPPSVHALAVRSARKHHFREFVFAAFACAHAAGFVKSLSPISCRRRVRTSAAIAGEGPAKSEAPHVRSP